MSVAVDRCVGVTSRAGTSPSWYQCVRQIERNHDIGWWLVDGKREYGLLPPENPCRCGSAFHFIVSTAPFVVPAAAVIATTASPSVKIHSTEAEAAVTHMHVRARAL